MTEPIVLTPIGIEPIKLIDPEEGREWLLTPALKGREAIRLMKQPGLASGAMSGDSTLEWFAGILSRSMHRHHPEMTVDRVLDEFDAMHIVEAVIGFLARVGQAASSGSTVVEKLLAQMHAEQMHAEQTTRGTTPAPVSV